MRPAPSSHSGSRRWRGGGVECSKPSASRTKAGGDNSLAASHRPRGLVTYDPSGCPRKVRASTARGGKGALPPHGRMSAGGLHVASAWLPPLVSGGYRIGPVPGNAKPGPSLADWEGGTALAGVQCGECRKWGRGRLHFHSSTPSCGRHCSSYPRSPRAERPSDHDPCMLSTQPSAAPQQLQCLSG
eukprot:COSAG01_NODE_4160_length_5287_cov_12.643986_4_plen_186_part_00